MTPVPLTARQQQVLDFIVSCIEERGCPPTAREIQAHFGWASRYAALCHLRAIAAKGALVLDGKRARSIRMLGVRWRMEKINARPK